MQSPPGPEGLELCDWQQDQNYEGKRQEEDARTRRLLKVERLWLRLQSSVLSLLKES